MDHPVPASLYKQVVRITHIYLGPAAERFIDRQVHNHLHKEPQELSREDLGSLIDWIRIAVSLITEDAEIIEEYTAQLERLVAPPAVKSTPPNPKLAYGRE